MWCSRTPAWYAMPLGKPLSYILATPERPLHGHPGGAKRARAEAAALAERFDALLAPTVGAPAPRGLDSTGDPYFCAPWSSAGLPAIALPSGLAGNGLPLSIQLVGAPFAEARLLAAAAWCERTLAFDARPPVL